MTKEELNALKEEIEILNTKLAELTDEELRQVTGGRPIGLRPIFESEAGEFVTDAYKVAITSEPGGGKTVCG